MCVFYLQFQYTNCFVFRTTKTGGLPNISYIKRKPEPLGTEFKNVVDGIAGNIIWLEIQEGKERMKNKQFQNLGSTAACTLRGVCATRNFEFFVQDSSKVPSNEESSQDKEHQCFH